MNFKAKNLLQTVFSNVPNGERFNYMFQKYVTRSLPRSDKAFQGKIDNNKKHLKYFKKYANQPIEISNYYEFGAGWDLITPIYFSSLGFKELHIIDIRKLIVPELIQHTLKKIFPNKSFDHSAERTLKELRIYYRAPMDARNTAYENESMDLIVSNVTFEHIPRNHIPSILKECHRLLKPNGIFSSRIDYNDHWSYFDKSITPYNYLKYSEQEWKKYNPSLHFQNRLRHKDYISMFEKSGFELLEVNPYIPENGMNLLKSVDVHSDFKHYTMDELAITSSEIVARKLS